MKREDEVKGGNSFGYKEINIMKFKKSDVS